MSRQVVQHTLLNLKALKGHFSLAMAPHADIDVSEPCFPASKDIKSSSTADQIHDATPRLKNPPCSLLRVEGTQILNAKNEEIVLKGAGVGGAWNMENFSENNSNYFTRSIQSANFC